MGSNGKLPGLFVSHNTRRKIEGHAKRTKATYDGRRLDAVAMEWRFRGEQSWRTLIVIPDGSPGNTQAEVGAAAEFIINALANEYVRAA